MSRPRIDKIQNCAKNMNKNNQNTQNCRKTKSKYSKIIFKSFKDLALYLLEDKNKTGTVNASVNCKQKQEREKQ